MALGDTEVSANDGDPMATEDNDIKSEKVDGVVTGDADAEDITSTINNLLDLTDEFVFGERTVDKNVMMLIWMVYT